MDLPWEPGILALEIGVMSYALIYLGGLVFFALSGMRKGIPGGVTIPQILLWGAASIPASAIVFLVAAQALLGAN